MNQATNQPTIVFRTKATPRTGFGHLRRCISLAKTLRRFSTHPLFIINQDETAVSLLKKEILDAITVHDKDESDLEETYTITRQQQQSPALIIFDSYDLPASGFSKFSFLPTAVIDDRIDLTFPVNLIINGSQPVSQAVSNNNTSKLLQGPEYLLLDEIFLNTQPRVFKDTIDNILITVGGSDPQALSLNLLDWTRQISNTCKIHLVMGPFFSETLKVDLKTKLAQDKNLNLYESPANLLDLMMHCDLAITAGGQTTFELAVTGTPAIAIQIIDNQKVNLELLSNKGSLIHVGHIADPKLKQHFEDTLKQLSQDRLKRSEMSKIGKQVIDGLGTERVAKAILNLIREKQ